MKFRPWRNRLPSEMLIATVLVTICVSSCTLVGWKASLTDQLNYESGIAMHPELDLAWLKDRAAENDPEAQTRLATLYYLGTGVAQNKVEAGQLFEKAAASGVTKAQYCVGCMFLNGEAGAKDIDRAAYWLKMAAAGNDSYAAYARDRLKNEACFRIKQTSGPDVDIVKK